MEHPRRVFSRAQSARCGVGQRQRDRRAHVDVHIRRLRQAIAMPHATDPIRTVRSAGYSLEPVAA
jgi:two-component system phosphate regulon response regulator PhoB